MIRQGKLCRECTDKKCVDEGTDVEPLMIECPSCGGRGCGKCKGAGDVKIIGCPNDYCCDMKPVLEHIDLYHEGLPPKAGGSLDQAIWFVTAARQLKNDENEAKHS